ncbi:MAG: hypothetical protein JJU42_00260 [Rhodobacteraceae bacterium]|nr:hypothetical protein [Paracoccaceae bacterium]
MARTLATLVVALTLGLGVNAPARALDLNLGGAGGISVGIGGGGGGLGVEANVGGDSGIGAGVSVGGESLAGVEASVGGDDGVNASATLGGDSLLEAEVGVGGGSSGTTPPGEDPGAGPGPDPEAPFPPIDGVRLQDVSPDLLAAARRARCRHDGNSSAYDGFVVFDPQGTAVGVVHGARVSTGLDIADLWMATLPRDGLRTGCVLIRAPQARVGNGAMLIAVPWERLATSLTR